MASHRGPSGRPWLRLRRRVLSEETHCYFCRERVDKTLRFPDPMAPDVHHIIPRIHGGPTLDRRNVALSHSRCNKRAGADLPTTSQRWSTLD